MLSRLLHRRRQSAPAETNLENPPEGWLWLVDPATDKYAVDEDDLYILVPDPDA